MLKQTRVTTLADVTAFLDALIPYTGLVCISTPYQNKEGYGDDFCKSTREALNKYWKYFDERGMHFCCCTLGEARRLAKNARLYGCFYGDIDCGPRTGKKTFSNVKELFPKLKLVEAELECKFLIVLTGGGVHVYLPYSEPVEKRLWKSHTEQILALFRKYKILGVDESASRDGVHMFRIPGSINPKYGKEVVIKQWHDQFITPKYVPMPTLQTEELRREYEEKRYEHLSPEVVRAECPQIAFLADQKEGQPYDAWQFCGTVLRRIPEGYDAFIDWSKFDERFEEDRARSVMDTATATDCARCETFAAIPESSYPEQVNPCQGCKHRALESNPLRVSLRSLLKGRKVTSAKDILLPSGYFFQGESLYYDKRTANGTPSGPMHVSSRALYIQGLYEDEKRNVVVDLGYQSIDLKSWYSIQLSKSECGTPQGLNKLADRVTIVREEARSYLHQALTLHEIGGVEMLPLCTAMKWITVKDDGLKFLYGTRILDSNGEYSRTIIREGDDRMEKLVKAMDYPPDPEGKRKEEWMVLMDTFIKDEAIFPELKVALALGFVAPVLRLLPESNHLNGAVINLTGETAGGKTVILRTIASLYGRPDDYMVGSDASMAATYNAIARAPSLPYLMDEFTVSPMSRDPTECAAFIKSICEGRSPERMTNLGVARETNAWNTTATIASNKPIIDVVRGHDDAVDAFSAEMRIATLEIPVALPGALKPYFRLQELYAVAGPLWVQHLSKPATQARLLDHMSNLDTTGFDPRSRYIFSLCGLLDWVVRELGFGGSGAYLCDFERAGYSIPVYFEEIQKSAFMESTVVRKLDKVEQAIVQFLHDNRGNGLTVFSYPARTKTYDDIQDLTPYNTKGPIFDTAYKEGRTTHMICINDGEVWIPHSGLHTTYKRLNGNGKNDFTNMVSKWKKKYRVPYTPRLILGLAGGLDQPPIMCYGVPLDYVREWGYGVDTGVDCLPGADEQ